MAPHLLVNATRNVLQPLYLFGCSGTYWCKGRIGVCSNLILTLYYASCVQVTNSFINTKGRVVLVVLLCIIVALVFCGTVSTLKSLYH